MARTRISVYDGEQISFFATDNLGVAGYITKLSGGIYLGAAPIIGDSLSLNGTGSNGAITNAIWNGNTIATTYGGTGLTSYALGDLLYASAANTLSKRAIASDGSDEGKVLVVGSDKTPQWSYTIGKAGQTITVAGDLVVQGEQVTMNTTQVLVEDTIMTLNSNLTGTPASTLTSGIEVERGTATNATLLWNENTDRWIAGLAGAEIELVDLSSSQALSNKTSYNGLVLTAQATGFNIKGGTTQKTLTVNNNLTLSGTDGVTLSFASNLTTTGAFTTSLTQTGNVTLTLPSVNGTLATLAGSETFTNKSGYNGLVVTANSGIITTGTWNGTAVLTTYGGTGRTSYTAGDMVYYSSGTALSTIAKGANKSVLWSNGTTPSWTTGLNLAGNLTIEGTSTNTFADTSSLTSATFSSSGFTGSGWGISYSASTYVGGNGATTGYSAVFDHLTVRGTMSIYELLIQQIRATNGSIFVTSVGKVESATAFDVNNDTVMTMEDVPTFAIGDLVRAKKVMPKNNAGALAFDTYQIDGVVQAVNYASKTVTVRVADSTQRTNFNTYKIGMEFVRMGSSDANRQGSVYMTSDDNNAPFMQIIDGVASLADWQSIGKIKVHLGKLTGITDTSIQAGALTGYGLYTSRIYLGTGSAVNNSLTLAADATGAFLTMKYGGNVVFDFQATGTPYAKIANFYFSNDSLWAGNAAVGNAATTFILDATNKVIKLGATASGITGTSASGIYLAGDGTFNIAIDAKNYIRKTASKMEIASEDFELNTGNLLISGNTTSSYLKVGTVTGVSNTTGAGLYVANDGTFIITNTDGSNYIKSTGTAVEIKSTDFDLVTGNLSIVGNAASSTLKMGTVTGVADTASSHAGLYVDNNGNFLLVNTAANSYIKSTGTGIEIKSNDFNLESGALKLVGDTTSSYIQLGTVTSATDTTAGHQGIYVDNTGNMMIQSGTTSNYLQVTTTKLEIGAGNLKLSGSTTNSFLKIGTVTGVTDTTAANQGIYLDNTGNMMIKSGTAANYFQVTSSLMQLVAGNLTISANATSSYIKLGTVTGVTDVAGSNTGTWIDNSGNFLSFGDSSDYIQRNGATLTIKATAFDLSAGSGATTLHLTTTYFRLGNTTSATDVANAGIYMTNGGDVAIVGDSGNYIKKTGTSLTLKSSTFNLTSGSLTIDSTATTGGISYGTSYSLKNDGTGSLANGNVSWTATTALISGWSIIAAALYKDESTNGVGLLSGHATSAVRMYAGATYANLDKAPFRINKYGKLYAQGADINGEAIVPSWRTTYNGAVNTASYFEETFAKSGAGDTYSDFQDGGSKTVTTDFGPWTITTGGPTPANNAPRGFIYHFSENVTGYSTGYSATGSGAISVYSYPNTFGDYFTMTAYQAPRKWLKVFESSLLTFPGVEYPKVRSTDTTATGSTSITTEYLQPTIEVGFVLRFINGTPSGNANPSLRIVIKKYSLTDGAVSGAAGDTITSSQYSVKSVKSDWFTAKIRVPSEYFETLGAGYAIKINIEVNPYSGDTYVDNLSSTISGENLPDVSIRQFFIRRPLVLKDVITDSLSVRGTLQVDGDLVVDGSQTVVYDQQAVGDFILNSQKTIILTDSSNNQYELTDRTTQKILEARLPASAIVSSTTYTNPAWITGLSRAKLANGTANHVVINDASGVMSSEAQLAISRGGTGKSSWTQWGLLYASATTTLANTGALTGILRGNGNAAPTAIAMGSATYALGVNDAGTDYTWINFDDSIKRASYTAPIGGIVQGVTLVPTGADEASAIQYKMGKNKLLVFLNGQYMRPVDDYVEVDNKHIKFNIDIAADGVISYVIFTW